MAARIRYPAGRECPPTHSGPPHASPAEWISSAAHILHEAAPRIGPRLLSQRRGAGPARPRSSAGKTLVLYAGLTGSVILTIRVLPSASPPPRGHGRRVFGGRLACTGHALTAERAWWWE